MTQQAYDFERQVGGARSGLAAEFWGFLSQNKKWWLLPIIVVFMLVGVLLVLGGTAAAPFIYTLF
jgi:Family of unknown function (DUF5989)